MMSDSEDIKERFAAAIQILLREREAKLVEFQQLWSQAKFREAYLLVDRLIREEGLQPAAEFRRADQDFFWEFVN